MGGIMPTGVEGLEVSGRWVRAYLAEAKVIGDEMLGSGASLYSSVTPVVMGIARMLQVEHLARTRGAAEFQEVNRG